MSHTSLTDTTPRSHRPGETAENYARRLTRARLKKSERAEIASLYERLDAERAAAGLPPACRQPTAPRGPPRTSSNGRTLPPVNATST